MALCLCASVSPLCVCAPPAGLVSGGTFTDPATVPKATSLRITVAAIHSYGHGSHSHRPVMLTATPGQGESGTEGGPGWALSTHMGTEPALPVHTDGGRTGEKTLFLGLEWG